MKSEGYKPVFEEARKRASDNYEQYFWNFHNHPELFHFAIAPANQLSPDDQALEFANALNPKIYQKLYDKGPSKVGGGAQVLDGVESRHILILTNLIDLLGTDWGHVVEIGGGYGNFLRLISDIVKFKSWAIMDMPYMLELQDWFFLQTNINSKQVHFIPDEETLPYMLVDLVIGSHSLSEFSIHDFRKYYYSVITRSHYFYYVSQTGNPSVELLEEKKSIILPDFYVKDKKEYENGRSVMYLFENLSWA